MHHPNEERLRSAYEAFFQGEAGEFDALLADDVVWHTPGRNVLSGDYTGKAAVYEFFGKVTETTGGTFRANVHDLLANDEHAVVLIGFTAERNGKQGSGNVVHVVELKDGKIGELWVHEGDQHFVDEFWAP